MLAVDVLHDALEAGAVLAFPAEAVPVLHHHLVVLAVQDRLPDIGVELLPRRRHGEAELVGEAGEQPVPVLRGGGAQRPRRDGPLRERELRVRDDEFLVDFELGADAAARGAGAEGVVEGEGARLDLVDGERVLVGAGEVFGERPDPLGVIRLEVDEFGQDAALGQAEGGFDGVGQALADAFLDHEAVHHHFDGVLELLAQLRRIAQLDELAVHAGPGVALGGEFLEEVDEFALAAADHGGQHLEARAVRELEQLVHDLLRGLLRHGLPADGAVRPADTGPEQAHVVVNLGDGAHGRARVLARGLLVDGHRRREALDEVDVGLVHLAEELPGVGGERFDVPALALGEDRVERQGGLAGAGQAGEHDHGIARQVEVDVAQVVLARALDHQACHVRAFDRGPGWDGLTGCQRFDGGLDFNGWIFSYSFRHESNANRKLLRKTIPGAADSPRMC